MTQEERLSALERLRCQVEHLRHWQRVYFKSAPGTPQKAEALTESKKAERETDKMLADLANRQRGLF